MPKQKTAHETTDMIATLRAEGILTHAQARAAKAIRKAFNDAAQGKPLNPIYNAWVDAVCAKGPMQGGVSPLLDVIVFNRHPHNVDKIRDWYAGATLGRMKSALDIYIEVAASERAAA